MAQIEKRVKYSGGILGPLSKDDLVEVSKVIDELLKNKGKLKSLTKKQADVLEKLDGHVKDVIEKAITVGTPF